MEIIFNVSTILFHNEGFYPVETDTWLQVGPVFTGQAEMTGFTSVGFFTANTEI